MNYRLSVSVVVQRDDGDILAVTNRRYGGFSVPGGKVDPGESFNQAARRELLEETGCEAVTLTKIGAFEHPSLQRDPDEDPWLNMGFLATIGDQIPRQVEKGTKPFWVRPEKLLKEGMYTGWCEWFFRVARIGGE